MSFDPREISKRSRLQTDINRGLEEARKLEAIIAERPLESFELVNLTLCYLEASNWEKVRLYAEEILKLEPSTENSDEVPIINENRATALYALSTAVRECSSNQQELELLVLNFGMTTASAESNWLKAHIFRGIGLTYLKLPAMQKIGFSQALGSFELSYQLCVNDPALRGLLPNLLSYMAYCEANIALLRNEEPLIGLERFELASESYNQFVTEQQIDLQRSHDYILSCMQHGMILCQIREQIPCQESLSNLAIAERLLIAALAAHKTNQTNKIWVGNTCFWLGRVYEGMEDNQKAWEFYHEAIEHYKTCSAKKEINAVEGRLGKLCFDLGLAYERANDNQKAWDFYHEAIEHYNKNPDAPGNQEKIYKLGEHFGNISFRLGRIYEGQGNNQKAKEFYNHALKYYETRQDNQKMKEVNDCLRALSFVFGTQNLRDLSITPPLKETVVAATHENDNRKTSSSTV